MNEFDPEPFGFDDKDHKSQNNNVLENNDSQKDKHKKEALSPKGRLLLLIYGTLLFTFFLIIKLPEARLQNYLLGHMRIQSQKMGFLFNAEKISLGIFFGPSLKIENAQLKSIDDDSLVIPIKYLKIRPHLLTMLPFANLKKVSFNASAFDGEISGTVGASLNSAPQSSPKQFSVELTIEKLSAHRLASLVPLFPLTIRNAILDMETDLYIDSDRPELSKGRIQMTLANTEIPAQSIMGFNLPRIAVAKAEADLSVAESKILIRTMTIGEDIKKDDIVAKITGESLIDGQKNLYNPLARFKLNAKAVFELSASLKNSFPFLDAILGPAKGSDGKYTYGLGGTLAMPAPRAGG